MDRLQIARPSRPRQHQGDEGPAYQGDVRREVDAVRREAHELRWVQGRGRGVARTRRHILLAESRSIHWEADMAEIIHRVGIQASPDKLFRALSTIEGLAGWWTENTRGVTDVGKTITFQFRNPNGETIGEFEMEVVIQEPFKKVQWMCVKGPAEWIGTEINFDLKQENDFTIVLFGH